MKLQDKLNALKKGFEGEAPKAVVEIMHRASENLSNSGILERTVKVGEKAPNFSLRNVHGEAISLRALLSKGPLVLSVYRGGWLPYCNLELEALEQAAERLSELGATFVAISPQLEVHSREFSEEKKLTFELLSDPGNEVAQLYGIRFELSEDLKEVYQKFGIDLPKYNGDDSWTLPLPARLIIDQGGVIRYAEINTDYTVRPEPEDTLEALKKIGG